MSALRKKVAGNGFKPFSTAHGSWRQGKAHGSWLIAHHSLLIARTRYFPKEYLPWTAKKKETLTSAAAPTNPAPARESAATAFPTTCKKGSCRAAFSRKTQKEPMTAPSSISRIWSPKNGYEPAAQQRGSCFESFARCSNCHFRPLLLSFRPKGEIHVPNAMRGLKISQSLRSSRCQNNNDAKFSVRSVRLRFFIPDFH